MPIYDVHTAMRKELRTGMPLLTETEQRQLVAWNATQQDHPSNVCVPQLVAVQAAATPDAVALVMGDQMLSYSELNRRANQLAHCLQKLGIWPNVLVGLCVELSLEHTQSGRRVCTIRPYLPNGAPHLHVGGRAGSRAGDAAASDYPSRYTRDFHYLP